MNNIISEEDFVEVWRANGRSDGCGLLDHADVKDLPLNTVWTVVECEDDDGRECQIALPGFHIVNKLGYVVTEISWSDETLQAYWIEPWDDE